MDSIFHEHSDYVNVPVRLLKRMRKDKSKWDLLALAVCLKLQNTHSGMYVHSPYALMKSFHCSYRKAERLIKDASHSDLFHYNEKTHFLVSRTFKIGAEYFIDKHGIKFYHDSVIVAEKAPDGTISHNSISRQLRDKLMLRMLSAKSSSDELQRHSNLCPEARKPLTHKYLANIAGISRSTATRHLNKLSKGDNRQLDVTTHSKIPVYDLEHDVVINDIPHRKPFISGRLAYVRDANDYTFTDKNHSQHFKHLIYNHPKRKTDNRVIKFPWEL